MGTATMIHIMPHLLQQIFNYLEIPLFIQVRTNLTELKTC